MSFFDAISASLFQQAADGRTIFRPFGRRFGTYLVSDARAAHLRLWVRRCCAAVFVVVVLLAPAIGFRALWATPLLVAGVYLKYWMFSRTLPHADAEPVHLTRSEMFATHASRVGTRILLPVTAGCALMCTLGIWMCFVQPGRDAYFVAGFFGLCTIGNGAQFWVARRNSR